MSAWVYVAGFVVLGVGGFVAVVGFTQGQPIRRQPTPQAQTLIEETTTFAQELRAIDVPAGPNYVPSGEWPVVAKHAAAEVEDRAEPLEVDPEPGPVVDEPPAAPWWTLPAATTPPRVALDSEPTPLFNAGRAYPTFDLDDLSHTNAWTRDGLLARIRQAEAEQAGVEAA